MHFPSSVKKDEDKKTSSCIPSKRSVEEGLEQETDDDECSVWTVKTDSLKYVKVGSTASTSTAVPAGSQLPLAIDLHIDRKGFFRNIRQDLRPFELSTWENDHLLKSMADEDLVQTILEIWRRTQLQKQERRIEKPTWYNWVILDISRRMYELLNRDNYQTLKKKLVESVSQTIYFQNNSKDLTQDGLPFSDYPLFDHGRVSRVVKIGAKFTDGICAFSDTIDFMVILKMSSKEFESYYYKLLDSSHLLTQRMVVCQRIFFSSNPLGPYFPKRHMV
ncbi:hypothetical protein K501DRAFT_273740 [Backusella circina FSU 941]|nr:hypothetical protein K501DRAFT_273740 [Backusella circina FSU 941]